MLPSMLLAAISWTRPHSQPPHTPDSKDSSSAQQSRDSILTSSLGHPDSDTRSPPLQDPSLALDGGHQPAWDLLAPSVFWLEVAAPSALFPFLASVVAAATYASGQGGFRF